MKKLSLRNLSFLGTALVLVSGLVSAFSSAKASNAKPVLQGSVTKAPFLQTDCTVTAGTITTPCQTSADNSGANSALTTIVE